MTTTNVRSLKKLKQLAQRRAKKTGETYSAALEAVSREAGFADYHAARQTIGAEKAAPAAPGAAGGPAEKASVSARRRLFGVLASDLRRASLTKAGTPRKNWPGKYMQFIQYRAIRELCETPAVRAAAERSPKLHGLFWRYEWARGGRSPGSTDPDGNRADPECLMVLVSFSQLIMALEAAGVDWRTEPSPEPKRSRGRIRRASAATASTKRANRSCAP